MVLYICFVAAVNVCLGFAIAVHLGWRHRLLTALAACHRQETAVASRLGELGHGSGETDAAASAAPIAPAENPPTAPSAPAEDSPAASADEGLPETMPLPVEAALPSPQAAEEESFTVFQSQAGRYEDEVARANDALRSYTGVADAAEIEACLSSLMEATNEYLRHREQLQKGLAKPPEEQPRLREVRASLEAAIERQDTQIQSTSDSIVHFDEHGDVEAGRVQVVGETSKLMDANHHLRDTLDVALLEVGHQRPNLPPAGRQEQRDPLTGLAARAALEAQLSQWWQDDPQHLRQLCLAMIDIDYFAQLNQQFGHKLGDKFLGALGQLLASERRGEGTVARFAGQCFALVFPDVDIRLATNAVERIRQIIDLARFRCRDDQQRLTVSCAVTAAIVDDTTPTLLARAEAALGEAKRYGRNRTFLHEGKYPTPVAPPSFSLETREITL